MRHWSDGWPPACDIAHPSGSMSGNRGGCHLDSIALPTGYAELFSGLAVLPQRFDVGVGVEACIFGDQGCA